MSGEVVHGRVDRDDRLTAADPLLLALQAGAGGALGGLVAVPQIASLARLARRLNILVSRGVVVLDGADELDLWVRARPEQDGVHLAIGGWNRRARPAAARLSPAEDADYLRSSGDWLWETDEALRLTIASVDGAETLIGQPFTRLFRFVEDESGELPILDAIAAHRRFEDQPAELRATRAPVRLAGMPLIDGRGRFAGFRGTASAGDTPMPVTPTGNAFGERLDAALRAPLARIVAHAESIGAQGAGPLRRDYADYATDIANAGRHLLALVDDLVDLQAIERPDFKPEQEPLDLADLARRAAGLLGVRAGAAGIRIDTPGEDEPMLATGDFRRVLQILVNLIGNAVRHSPEGGMIWIRVEREGEQAAITVADQGRGIDAADQARIFDKFERIAPSDATGSGLGLYISRRLARAMGGDIGVDSAPGQGARFTLTLPAA